MKKILKTLTRGACIKVSFNPIRGHEQAGYRLALVISNQEFHEATGFALCIPITSKVTGLLFEIPISGKKVSGVALVHGSRMLDLMERESFM